MATTENNGLMIYQDESGNKFILYPITKADLVDGLEELLDGKAAAAHAGQHASGGSDPITPASIGAALASHNHSASDVTSGTFSTARLPTVPVSKGGTGSTTAAGARSNLGAAPVYTYGTTDLTAGTSALETGKLHFVYE